RTRRRVRTVRRDEGGQYRWRLVHDNGNVIADGGEGYASK
ncbi:YegP family protein, partial [Halapricum sp. CBA1109]